MISLFLDTSSSYLTVAVLKNSKVLLEEYILLEKQLSKMALYEISQVMDKLNLKPNDIDQICCVNGPGSFTGLRIGVTIAKTYSWGLNKKLISVSSLFSMATSIIDKDYIIPIIDARRNYVFAAIYDRNYKLVLEEQYISIENLLNIVKNLSGSYSFVATSMIDNINEIVMYKPNLENLFNNLEFTSVDPNKFVPNYLKKTEAEENLYK